MVGFLLNLFFSLDLIMMDFERFLFMKGALFARINLFFSGACLFTILKKHFLNKSYVICLFDIFIFFSSVSNSFLKVIVLILL